MSDNPSFHPLDARRLFSAGFASISSHGTLSVLGTTASRDMSPSITDYASSVEAFV